jgi:hypothetical protein
MLSSAITPDTKKKKIALPSVLSNIRNAVGRAGGTDESGRNEVEIRPLMGNNKSSEDLVGIVGTKKSYVTDNSRSLRDRSTVPSSSSSSSGIPPPPLSGASPLYGAGQNSSSSSSRQTLPPRNAVSTSSINSWSATLQTYSERIGSQWRKQRKNRRDSNEKNRRRGVTINTQPIIIVLGLFFIGFPILLMLFLLARKAVFGDEGIDNVAKHEVPAHDEVVPPSNNIDVNDWKELTSEDNPLGLVLNNEKNEVGTGIVSNEEADTNEVVDVNGASIKKEPVLVEDEVSIINEQNTNEISDVTVEDETVDNASNSLRGSREETMNALVANQEDLPVVLNNKGDNGNMVEKNDEEAVAVTAISPALDEKTTLESNKKKEMVVEDLVVHEQEVKADNTVDVTAAAKDENNSDVGNVLVENAGD